MWERSFVAVSVLLGAALEDVMMTLPEGAEGRIADVTTKLRDARRKARAQGLAEIAQEIATAIEEVTLG